jgi:hypothetical protein
MRSAKQNIAVPDIAELRDELRHVGEMLAFLVNAASEDEAVSLTVKEFRARHRLSESQYHKLNRLKKTPRTMRVGSIGVRISVSAEADWVREREREAAEAATSQPLPDPEPASSIGRRNRDSAMAAVE